jgi:hypothetical protein
MRRGAAWPLAERPSSCLTARSAVSRTDRRPHRRASWDAEHRRRRPQEHGSASQRAPARRGGPGYPELALPCQPQQHPVSCVRCPVSTRPVSTRAMSTRPASSVRVSAVRCGRPVSGVQLGVRASAHPASAIRAFPRLRCPNRVSSSSTPMRRAATRPGRPESAWSLRTVSTTGWSSARVGAGRSKLAQAVLGQRRRRLGRSRREVLGQRPGSTAWPTRRSRLRRDRSSVGSRVRGEVRPPAAWLGAGRQGHDRRHEADHDLGAGWPAPGGPWARLRGGRAAPTRPRQGSGCDRPGGGSALSWENSGGPART